MTLTYYLCSNPRHCFIVRKIKVESPYRSDLVGVRNSDHDADSSRSTLGRVRIPTRKNTIPSI